MHESPTPDQDLYQLLGVDRGRTAGQIHNDLDGRLRGAQRGTHPLSPEEWNATRIGRDVLGDLGRRRRYDAMLEAGHRPTWTELEGLASAPMGRKARLAVIVVIAIVVLGVVVALVQYFTGSGDDDGGSTAAAVDNAVVYEVGDSGTVLQATDAIDMTAVAPEAADIGLCGDRLCPSGHDPAVGPMADGSIAVTWGDGNGQDHRVAVSPDTGEIVDYVTASTSGRDERTAVLVGKPDRGWPGWDSNTLYRVGDDGETIKGDLVYYETDGTVWFISYQDRGTLYKGTVVKR